MEPRRSIPEDHVPQPPSFADNLTTIRQMLATLDTLTIAGQRHLMAKVFAFVDGQVHQVVRHAASARSSVLVEHLAVLKHESERQLPSIPAFGQRAESLLALLGHECFGLEPSTAARRP